MIMNFLRLMTVTSVEPRTADPQQPSPLTHSSGWGVDLEPGHRIGTIVRVDGMVPGLQPAETTRAGPPRSVPATAYAAVMTAKPRLS